MKNNLFLKKPFLFLILVIIPGCGYTDSPETSIDNTSDALLRNIEKDLGNGKGIIVYQMTNNDRSSEQYADWSSYLNEFTSSKTPDYVAYASSEKLNAKLLNKQANVAGSYTLFFKKGKPTYFYEGVIVEAMVYMAVDNIYSNGTPSPMFQAFLPDVLEVNLQ